MAPFFYHGRTYKQIKINNKSRGREYLNKVMHVMVILTTSFIVSWHPVCVCVCVCREEKLLIMLSHICIMYYCSLIISTATRERRYETVAKCRYSVLNGTADKAIPKHFYFY